MENPRPRRKAAAPDVQFKLNVNILFDPSLSLAAKGLFLLIAAKLEIHGRQGWGYADLFPLVSDEGELRRALAELEEYGNPSAAGT